MVTIAVPLAVALACAIAGQSVTALAPGRVPFREQEERGIYEDMVLSAYDPQYLQYDENPEAYDPNEESYDPAPSDTDDLLTKEIDRLKSWSQRNEINPPNVLPTFQKDQMFIIRLLGLEKRFKEQFERDSKPLLRPPVNSYSVDLLTESDEKTEKVEKSKNDNEAEETDKKETKFETEKKTKEEIELESLQKNEKKKIFALTPKDDGYFDAEIRQKSPDNKNTALMVPRKTRQNPNLSRSKALLAENLDQLRRGFTDKATGSTVKPHHIHVIEAAEPTASTEPISKTVLASIVVSVALAIVGFIFGWYTISQKVKAVPDLDYPTYGVTGPTLHPSGDCKLAHSAHMYHYQHQKQQILAMESCLGRNGSISDPDSEEENEEGDYTVYECPGFATTGNMEVKNPLFNEEPTPATPIKCEVVQPQPKE